MFKEYRCLVCQNQSIEDSDAELAGDLRAIIREQVSAGNTPAEIQEFLVSRYGDWVLLTPKFTGATVLLWVFPFAILGLGLLLFVFMLRKRKDKTSKQDAVETTVSDEDLKAIEKFRQ